MHRVTVIRGIKYLEEQGLLAKTKRKSANRGWEANHYQVLIKDIHTPSSKCTTPLVAISDYPSSKEILELNPVELYKEELESKSFYLGKKSGAGLDALREVLRKDPRVRFILGEGTDSLE